MAERQQDFSYFPVLRWKPAEKAAIASVSQLVAQRMCPIFEFVPASLAASLKSGKSIEEHFNQSAIEIFRYWGSNCFIDLQHIANLLNEEMHPYSVFVDRSVKLGLAASPVVRLDPAPEESNFLSLLKTLKTETLAIRLTNKDLSQADFRTRLHTFIDYLNIPANEIIIIYDAKIINEKTPSLSKILKRIPDLSRWKELIFVGGSFPIDLSQFEMGEYELIRQEWVHWRKLLSDLRSTRIPKYGDYTIQHPIFTEKLIQFSPSPSIRYTAEGHWVIMRGKRKYGSQQYLAHAQQLCGRPEYKGASFSRGDRFIFEKSQELEKEGKLHTGNSKDWLSASINHHFPLAVTQLETVMTETVQRLRNTESRSTS